MNGEFKQLIYALWLILPAYIANGSPVVGIRILKACGVRVHPIDGGKRFVDGRRVFGDNKTWEGLLVGILAGSLTGAIQTLVCGDGLFTIRGFVLGLGAMLGDLIGSFVKRRIGIDPGNPLPVLDQLLFLLTAVALGFLSGFLYLTVGQILFLVVVTAVLHVVTNYVAYKLRLKSVPW